MDCSQPGQNLLVYTFCEISIFWIGAEVFEWKYCDSLCCTDLLGKWFAFVKDPTKRRRRGNQQCYQCKNGWFLLIHLRDGFVTCEQSLSTVLMSGRRERALFLLR